MEITSRISIGQLLTNDDITLCGNGDILKANVDIERERVYVGLSTHADMEEEMISSGSERGDLVGLNIFIDELVDNEPLSIDMIEFSSMINFDINKKIGDLRSGNMIHNDRIIGKTMEILDKWLVQ